MFYAKVFKEFLFVFLYLIMCIVFKMARSPASRLVGDF